MTRSLHTWLAHAADTHPYCSALELGVAGQDVVDVGC